MSWDDKVFSAVFLALGIVLCGTLALIGTGLAK